MKDRDEFESFIQQQLEGFQEKPLRSVWDDIERGIPNDGNGGFNMSILFIALAFASILLVWSFNIIKGKNIFGNEMGALDLSEFSEAIPHYTLFPSFKRARTSAKTNRKPIMSFWVNDETEQKQLMDKIQQFFKDYSYLGKMEARYLNWSVDIKKYDDSNSRGELSASNANYLNVSEHTGSPIIKKHEFILEKINHSTLNQFMEMALAERKKKILIGEKLFADNCASCHSSDMQKNLTGPALGGVTEKREKDWLYDFTRNSMEMIESGDRQALDLWEDWQPTTMNDFPELTDEKLDDLYLYVDDVYYNTSPKKMQQGNKGKQNYNHRVNESKGDTISGDDIFIIKDSGPIDSLLDNGLHFQDTLEYKEQKQF